MHVDCGERSLGQVLEGDGELTGFEVGGDRAGEFDVEGEAVCDQEDAIAITGLGLAKVDRAWQRARQGGTVDRKGADLGEFWALGFFFGAEPRFGFGAYGLTVDGAGVDRETRRKGDGRRPQLGGRRNGGLTG